MYFEEHLLDTFVKMVSIPRSTLFIMTPQADGLQKTPITYHLNTVWLFAYEQLFDAVIPCGMFGIAGALSSDALHLPSIPFYDVLQRMPLVVFWLWLVILQCCIHNQRHPNSINEDAINKPWRPLPAERITIKHTTYLLLLVYFVAGTFSYWLGLLPLLVFYTMLVMAYNDFGASDHSGLSRAILNGAGFFCFYYGTLHIAVGRGQQLSERAYHWVAIMVSIFSTTIHAQDFRDQKGDRARGRNTIITAIGEVGARWSVVLAVLFWSLATPVWFGIGWKGMIVPGILGSVVMALTLMGMRRKDPGLDAVMYRVWGVWMLSFSLMPLLVRWVV
jgi:4-hydroxybenzoate polyprenyltransferase